MKKPRKYLTGQPRSKLAKKKKTQRRFKAQKETKPEKQFREILKESNVHFTSQKNVKKFLFDFYLPDYDVLIEVDGDYWHGNPAKFPDPSSMQRKNRRRDKLKSKVANEQGYKVLRFWESDINADPAEIKRQLLEFLNNHA